MIESEVHAKENAKRYEIRDTDTPTGVEDLYLRQTTYRETIIQRDFSYEKCLPNLPLISTYFI